MLEAVPLYDGGSMSSHLVGAKFLQNTNPTLSWLEPSSEGIKFQDIWLVLVRRRRLALVTGATVLALTLAKTAYERVFHPVYQGSFQLLISKPISSNTGQSSGTQTTGANYGNVALRSISLNIPTLINVLTSPMILGPFNQNAGGPRQNLSISAGTGNPGDSGGVLTVSITGTQPAQDLLYLEKLAKLYLNYANVQRQQSLTDGLRFLDSQAPQVQAKIQSLGQSIRNFQIIHQQPDPEVATENLKASIADNESLIKSIQFSLQELSKLKQELATGLISAKEFNTTIGSVNGTAGGSNSPSGGSSGGINVVSAAQNILNELEKSDLELAQARTNYRPDSILVRQLEDRRRSQAPILRSAQQNLIKSAILLNKSKAKQLTQQKTFLLADFKSQVPIALEYQALKSQLETSIANLASIQASKESFKLELAQTTPPWEILSPPSISSYPVQPSLSKGLSLGLLLGLSAGLAAALLRDRLDHVYHQPAEAHDELKEPLLAHIPHVDFFRGVREDKRFVLEELDQNAIAKPSQLPETSSNQLNPPTEERQLSGYQRFYYQEAFRNLFTSLRFLSAERPLTSVALTSSIPNEGKSLVNVLLAKTLIEMGKRVLLIDADMRKPQLHHRLGMNNILGLSNILTDDQCHWSDAIQQVKGYMNWSIITSGTIPPDPTRLLSSSKMHQTTQDIANSGLFDLVLYDTPPVLGLADAMLTSEHVDGLILLVSLNSVDRDLPKEAIHRIQTAKAPLLGIVTNAVRKELASNTTNGYGYKKGRYGYGYGYGYGGYNTQHATAYYANAKEGNNVEQSSHQTTERVFIPANWIQKIKSSREGLIRWIDR